MSKNIKVSGFAQDIYAQSSSQKEAELDTVRALYDGRMFAYARAGATALAAGVATTSSAPDANVMTRTLSANGGAAIGATEFKLTTGGAITADFYKDGYVWASNEAGEGHLYRVKGHAAGTTDTVIYLKDPLRVAFVASTTVVSMFANRQSGVIIAANNTTAVAAPAGIPPIAVTEYYYFWNQVKGPAVYLASGTQVLGDPVAALTSAGALGPMSSSAIITPWGIVLSKNASTEYGLIALAIPGY